MRYKKLFPSKPYVSTSRTLCDFCSEGVHQDNDEIEICAKIGDVFDGDDCRDVEEIDCCRKCWREKVRPALEAIGAKFREHGGSDYHEHMPWDPEAKPEELPQPKKP